VTLLYSNIHDVSNAKGCQCAGAMSIVMVDGGAHVIEISLYRLSKDQRNYKIQLQRTMCNSLLWSPNKIKSTQTKLIILLGLYT